MARFKVDIGDAEGMSGDTVIVQAPSAAAAREQVLESEDLLRNPHWGIIGEPEELS